MDSISDDTRTVFLGELRGFIIVTTT
jgi:hypothetical protein